MLNKLSESLPQLQSKMKVCRITLEMTSEFLNYLKINLNLNEFHEYKDKIDPAKQLAIITFFEGSGEFPNNIEKWIRADWKGMIKTVPEERRVYQNGKLIGGNN